MLQILDTPIHIHVQESRKLAPNKNPVARPGEKYPTLVPGMTQEDFSTWKIPYLQELLASRVKNNTETKETPVRNCFSAYELGLKETKKEDKVKKNHLDKLVVGNTSCPEVFYKKSVLKNLTKFTG